MMRCTGYRIRTFLLCPPGILGENDNLFQSVASSSRDGRLLTASIEQTQPALLAVSIFLRYAGTIARRILNFSRRLKVPGNLSSVRSLLKHLQEPCSVQPILFTPDYQNILPSLVAFEKQHASKGILNGTKSGA